MSDIPEGVMDEAREAFVRAITAARAFKADDGVQIIASAILAERKRCADWCDKTAFLEWEQGELRAQRALQIARDNILSGDDA